MIFTSQQDEWVVGIIQFFSEIIPQLGLLTLLSGLQYALLLASYLWSLSFFIHQAVNADVLEVTSVILQVPLEQIDHIDLGYLFDDIIELW